MKEKTLVQRSNVFQKFLEFHRLVNMMKRRQEILTQSTQVDDDRTPPTDDVCNSYSDASVDRSEFEHTQIDEKECKSATNNCIVDTFSMSTHHVNDIEHLSPLPSPSQLPLKSCLKRQRSLSAPPSVDIFDTPDVESISTNKNDNAKKTTSAQQKNGMTASEALDELKDFVKILIL